MSLRPRTVRAGPGPGLRDYVEQGYGSGLPGSVRQPPPGIREAGLAPDGAPTILSPRPGGEEGKLVKEQTFHAAEYVAYVVGITPLRIDLPLRRDRRAVAIKNSSLAATVWVGSANNVAVNNGWPLAPGESVQFPYDENVPVYAVATAAGTVVALIQFA